MPPALSADERKQVCEKLLQMQANDAKFDSPNSKIERYVSAIEKADGKYISDALADEKLLPEKFRASALRAEQHTIEKKMRPDGLAVIIYDSVTMDVAPWGNVQLRGWVNGQPSQKETADLEVAADEMDKEIARLIEQDVERSRSNDP